MVRRAVLWERCGGFGGEECEVGFLVLVLAFFWKMLRQKDLRDMMEGLRWVMGVGSWMGMLGV